MSSSLSALSTSSVLHTQLNATVLPPVTSFAFMLNDGSNNSVFTGADKVWVSQTEGQVEGVLSGVIETICLSWTQCGLFMAFLLLIVVILVGNTLVILAILTTRRLRTVTNCFVMSLAIADWLVGTFVMPPAVSLYIAGKL